MKTPRAALISCLLALVALSFESVNYTTLNSIGDLKNVSAETHISMQIVLLLHLLANQVSIDNNNKVSPSFDPTQDFGSHFYSNYEKLLDPAPYGCRYYTLGNVNLNKCGKSRKVPSYVRRPKALKNIPMENRARTILCLRHDGNRWSIHEVYLTQHYRWEEQKGSKYDSNHTFEVTPNLLRELKKFSFNEDIMELQKLRDQYDQNIDNRQLNNIINEWGRRQAPLGLLIFLIFNIFKKRMNRSYVIEPTSEWQNCELEGMSLYVVTGYDGYANIHWNNVTQDLIDAGVAVVLFKNQMDQKKQTYKHIRESSGVFYTSVPLNDGLQVRLHRSESHWLWSNVMEELCRGPEFQSPDAVPVTHYAQLQLFVRNGYSCFRLYIDDCDEWKMNFKKSWVALYSSDKESTHDYRYYQWQWVTKFEQGPRSEDYETFEYCTRSTVEAQLQARFVSENYHEEARTPVWPEGVVSQQDLK
uniref:Uncharacterized protein n=1 Tax=Periophthalmus magnuspinnatus TaxID=409849 RepID=A0A3B3ZSE7_9GOBI